MVLQVPLQLVLALPFGLGVAPAFSTILLRFSCYVVAFLILLHCHGLWSQLDVVTSMDMDLA